MIFFVSAENQTHNAVEGQFPSVARSCYKYPNNSLTTRLLLLQFKLSYQFQCCKTLRQIKIGGVINSGNWQNREKGAKPGKHNLGPEKLHNREKPNIFATLISIDQRFHVEPPNSLMHVRNLQCQLLVLVTRRH